jgi:hypothetical protein
VPLHCFLSGAMLVHNKFVDAHTLTLMTFVSPSGVGGDIHQPYILVLLSWTLQHVVPLIHLSP